MPHLSKADKEAKVSETEARRRKEVALARLRELEVDLKEGKLVLREYAEEAWSGMIVAARSKLLGLGSKLGPLLISAKNTAEAKSIIDKGVREALSELAQGKSKAGLRVARKKSMVACRDGFPEPKGR